MWRARQVRRLVDRYRRNPKYDEETRNKQPCILRDQLHKQETRNKQPDFSASGLQVDIKSKNRGDKTVQALCIVCRGVRNVANHECQHSAVYRESRYTEDDVTDLI